MVGVGMGGDYLHFSANLANQLLHEVSPVPILEGACKEGGSQGAVKGLCQVSVCPANGGSECGGVCECSQALCEQDCK